MSLENKAAEILKETSRTFYVSIIRLPSGLREAVMSSYLCLRAIDEIEDHKELDRLTKVGLLRAISLSIQRMDGCEVGGLCYELSPYDRELPQVTSRINEWMALAPRTIAHRIWDATAAMAERMSYWTECGWQIHSKADLDSYTYCVAGSTGLLLSDLWAWYDGTVSNRAWAVNFGRGLQSVNILRNRSEDLCRCVDFYPDGWTDKHLHAYARRNLFFAQEYVNALPAGPARDFCLLPLALANATLNVLGQGERKLSRDKALSIMRELGGESVDGSRAPDEGNGSVTSSTCDFENHQPVAQTTKLSSDGEQVIIVDENDEVIDVGEKIKTHKEGKLHRAFSIFVFSPKGDLLLQKRASTKYHSNGLWSNTCCGHPQPGESTVQAARRRLQEEMGFVCDLEEVFEFTYRVQLTGEMSEHEYDHVLVGVFNGEPEPCKHEVDDWKWMELEALKKDILEDPGIYTYWLKIALELMPSSLVVSG